MCKLQQVKGSRNTIITATICGIVLVASVVGGIAVVQHRNQDNCERIHHLWTALDQILKDNNSRIMLSVRRGNISSQQAQDYLAFNQKNRLTLRKGDCNNSNF